LSKYDKDFVVYNKLVRDKIPDIIEKAGKIPAFKELPPEELGRYLKLKLLEEAGELQGCNNDELCNEIADVLEVLYSIAENQSIDWALVDSTSYADVRENVGHSPGIMDFFVNPLAEQPKEFIKEFNGWLQTKKHMDDLTSYEQGLIDTDGENFLLHLERELHPSKSYKMVVLQSILTESRTKWSIEELATKFRAFYLKNREHMEDYNALWNYARKNDPDQFSTSKVMSHLKTMPLKYLSNSDDKHFVLDAKSGMFYLKDKFVNYWQDDDYRGLVADRTQFALADYFYRKTLKEPASILQV